MFKINKEIFQNLHWYFLSVDTIYFKDQGFQYQSHLHHCSNTDVGNPQENNQVCVDTEKRTVQTTKNFKSSVASGLDVRMVFNLRSGSISGPEKGRFEVKISIRDSVCEAQQQMVSKMKDCQLTHIHTTSTGFEDKVATVFTIEPEFIKQPLVLSKIKIRARGKALPDQGSLYLTVYDLDGSKAIVDNMTIATFGGDTIYVDIYDKVGSSKYKVVLKDQKGDFYKQLTSLSFYKLKELCTLNARCYQGTLFWIYLKERKTNCDSSTDTIPLADNYERCIGKSKFTFFVSVCVFLFFLFISSSRRIEKNP